jgi:hypothetical protein
MIGAKRLGRSPCCSHDRNDCCRNRMLETPAKARYYESGDHALRKPVLLENDKKVDVRISCELP